MPREVPICQRPEFLLAQEGGHTREVLAEHVDQTRPVHVGVDVEALRRAEALAMAHEGEQHGVEGVDPCARFPRGPGDCGGHSEL
jgi:hypothetical protein